MEIQPQTAATTTLADCVELGIWTKVPLDPPAKLTLALKDLDKDAAHAIKVAGVMTFHSVGCTGARNDQQTTTRVAEVMALQVDHPHRLGGTPTAVAPSFLYHLGDVIYKKDKPNEEELTDNPAQPVPVGQETDFGAFYDAQFYKPYQGYAPPIFALAGNHDGKDKPLEKPRKSAILHFLKNFCGQNDGQPSDNKSSKRPPMNQPYPYWLLETPLAYFVGLYTNVCNAGRLDDPTRAARPQFDWLVQTLRTIKNNADGKAVILGLHYPPYSAAVNFKQRGDPNQGPSAPPSKDAKPVGMLLQQAFLESGQFPDVVLSAHAHHYQRLTYTCANGRQIPYLIAGCGGHSPIEKLSRPCAKVERAAEATDAKPAMVWPDGLSLPVGDAVELTTYNEHDFGFLRLTLDGNKHTLTGEYFAAYSLTPSARTLPVLDDSFTLDLRAHIIA